MTDEEIVERIIAGEPALFALLMTRYQRRIRRIVQGIVRNVNEIDDLVQQIYLNAYANLDQFAGKSKFSTWLLRIAIHQAMARAREEHRIAEETHLEMAEGAVDDRINSGLNPEQQAFVHELRRAIEREILALPVRYRAVLELRDVDGLSTAETADCMHVTAAVVRTRLKRARGMLRARLLKRRGTSFDSLFGFLGEQCDRMVRMVRHRTTTLPASRY